MLKRAQLGLVVWQGEGKLLDGARQCLHWFRHLQKPPNSGQLLQLLPQACLNSRQLLQVLGQKFLNSQLLQLFSEACLNSGQPLACVPPGCAPLRSLARARTSWPLRLLRTFRLKFLNGQLLRLLRRKFLNGQRLRLPQQQILTSQLLRTCLGDGRLLQLLGQLFVRRHQLVLSMLARVPPGPALSSLARASTGQPPRPNRRTRWLILVMRSTL